MGIIDRSMKKVKNFSVVDFAIFKAALIIFGMILGAYMAWFIKTYIWLFVILFLVFYIVIMHKALKV